MPGGPPPWGPGARLPAQGSSPSLPGFGSIRRVRRTLWKNLTLSAPLTVPRSQHLPSPVLGKIAKPQLAP